MDGVYYWRCVLHEKELVGMSWVETRKCVRMGSS